MLASRLASFGGLLLLAVALTTGCATGDDDTASSSTGASSVTTTTFVSATSTSESSGGVILPWEADYQQEAGASWSPVEAIPAPDVETVSGALGSCGLSMLFPSRPPMPGPGPVSVEFSLYRTPSKELIELDLRVEGPGPGDWMGLWSSSGSFEDSAWPPEYPGDYREIMVRGRPGRAYPRSDVAAEMVTWQEDGQPYVATWRWLTAELTAEQVVAWLDSWYGLPELPARYLAHADDDTWGYIDATGAWAIEPGFTFAYPFSDGLAAVMIDDRYGYIDTTGALVIPPDLLDATSFSGGRAAVFTQTAEGRGYGYIDTAGELVVQPRFGTAGPFSQGLAAVRVDDLWGYIDRSGTLVIEPQFGAALAFSEGAAPVWVSADDGVSGPAPQTGPGPAVPPRPMGSWGYIDPTGAFTIDAQFDDATAFSEGLAAVRTGAGWGYLDPTGAFAIDPRFDQALPFSKGLAAVRVNGGWGYIDRTGEWVIEPRFADATSFSQDLAAVEVDGGWGYVDRTGEFVIAPAFDSAHPFSGALAQVYLDSAHQIWGYIDTTGAVIWQRH